MFHLAYDNFLTFSQHSPMLMTCIYHLPTYSNCHKARSSCIKTATCLVTTSWDCYSMAQWLERQPLVGGLSLIYALSMVDMW